MGRPEKSEMELRSVLRLPRVHDHDGYSGYSFLASLVFYLYAHGLLYLQLSLFSLFHTSFLFLTHRSAETTT